MVGEAWMIGLPIAFFLGSLTCLADLYEAALIGSKERRIRYPIQYSPYCWMLSGGVGILGCLVYLLVIKYPDLVAGTEIGNQLSVGGWLLTSLASGLGAMALVRSKLFSIGDNRIGFETIYEMFKGMLIEDVVERNALLKRGIIDNYAGKFNDMTDFAAALRDHVAELLVTRFDDQQAFLEQYNSIMTTAAPETDPAPKKWEQYHRTCIRTVCDFAGITKVEKFLGAYAPKAPLARG